MFPAIKPGRQITKRNNAIEATCEGLEIRMDEDFGFQDHGRNPEF